MYLFLYRNIIIIITYDINLPNYAQLTDKPSLDRNLPTITLSHAICFVTRGKLHKMNKLSDKGKVNHWSGQNKLFTSCLKKENKH